MPTRCAVPLMRYAIFSPMFVVSGMLLAASIGAVAQKAEDSEEPAATVFSSSTEQLIAVNDGSLSFGAPNAEPFAGKQQDRPYGPYGRQNRGWMSHATFEIGGGFNAPSRGTSDAVSWGGNITAGAGYSFTPHFSLLTEYQFIADKLPGAIISQTGAQGGSAHIWSFTLAPVIDLFPRRTNDVYITGGGGFYRKVTSFTDPAYFQYCNYFYCGIGTVNQVVGHFSSNQGGWNVGLGYTRKIGGFGSDSKAKLFAEVRYLDIDTPAVDSSPNGLGRTTFGAGTKLVPVTFGVRF